MTNFEDTLKKMGEGISLSHDERAKMDRVIREYAALKPLARPHAHSATLSYSWLSFGHRPVAAALVIVMVFGSGVSYAAENALPGDALYTVKTYINEPAKIALATSAEAKAEVQIELAERRIEEAAILAAEGRLDEKTEDELAVAFESHAAAVAENMAKADEEDDSASTELASRFETRLAAHENVLLEVESEGEVTHSNRLAEAIRSATEETLTHSLGNALAANILADTMASTDAASEGVALSVEPMAEPAASPMAMTMSIASDITATAPVPEARNAKMAVDAQEQMPTQMTAPDAKKIARMKTAAEKSLKSAQKKFKSMKSLSSEARARAEADFALADSLIVDGSAYLEADADADAFMAFKESLRVTEQASVYMKAAPTLEKARSRARSIRGDIDSTRNSSSETKAPAESVTGEISPPPSTEEPRSDDSPENDTDEHGDDVSTEGGVNIKLDLSL